MALNELKIWNRALSRLGAKQLKLETTEGTVDSVTAANPPVATQTAHGFSTGDFVLVYAMDEMLEINNRIFKIEKVDANSYKLLDEDGSGYTAEATGGLSKKIKDVTAGKAALEAHDAWTPIRDEVATSFNWNELTRRSRLHRPDATKAISAITAANPPVVTTAAHGYSTGDSVLIEGIVGMTELNNRWFTVTVTAATTFSLDGEDATLYTAWSSAGTSTKGLAPLKPDSEYDFVYDIPADCHRILDVIDPWSDEDWVREGDKVLTDAGPTVQIRYILDNRDVTKYGPLLDSVMAARLAVELAEALTQSNKKKEFAFAQYMSLKDMAEELDGAEQSPMDFQEDDFILARIS